jgi:hypothetical protein
MAGQSRTLKLSILADVDQLKKSLAQANGDVDNSSTKMGEFSKKAGMAFAAAGAAAGAYAVKLAVDGVKAAIEDEAAQIRLATALKNATGATNAMIASVEKQILKTSLATGVADDKLRPALQRLSLSTNDVTKAQGLLNLALDISQATGKGLDSVANALGKAYDGNTAALGKLGIGLSSAELKAMSFEDVQTRLSDLFGGAAAANAETFAGRLEILKVTFDEAKESVGAKLLPIIQQLVEFVINQVLPALGKFAAYFKPITDAIANNKEAFIELIGFIQKYVVPVIVTVLGGAFDTLGKIVSGLVNLIGGVARAINAIVNTTIDAINALINAYNRIPILPNISTIKKPTTSGDTSNNPPGSGAKPPGGTNTTTKKDEGGQFSTGGISLPKSVTNNLLGNTNITAAGAATALEKIANAGGTNGVAGAGTTDSQNWARLQAAAAKLGGAATDSQNTARLAAQALRMGGAFTDSQNTARLAGNTINLTVNGAIDSEGTARTIVNTLNDSFYRGTGGAGALQAI